MLTSAILSINNKITKIKINLKKQNINHLVINEWVVPDNVKLPYTKYHSNGLNEVFDGESSTYMGKELYERFQKLMLEEGLKYRKI